MTITGYDTVLLSGGRIDAGVRLMLDDLHRRWPHMVVSFGMTNKTFLPWPKTRSDLPAGTGEVFVARDNQMRRRWDDVGYSLEQDEGPFAVFYQPTGRSEVEIQLHEDPYNRGFRFEPYPATLVTIGLSLVTMVTPDIESQFSQRILDMLRQVLIGQAAHS